MLSVQSRAKTPAAISQDCRLGIKRVGHPHPKRKPIRSALIKGMCDFENGTRAATAASKSNAELTSHTSPFCNDYNKLQSFAFWSLCSFFPHAKNCAFIFFTRTQVRLFLTCGSPCVCSTSDCAMLLRSRRTKRGGIISARHLFMRVLSVVPRHAVTVGSLAMGNGDRENT